VSHSTITDALNYFVLQGTYSDKETISSLATRARTYIGGTASVIGDQLEVLTWILEKYDIQLSRV
jgi:hypothetical protein